MEVTNYQSYENLASTTKMYSPKIALIYVTLGLAGEVGEFYEKLNEEAPIDAIEAEFQDCLWYMAAIRTEFNLKERIDWPEPSENPTVALLKVSIHSGAICEQMKKYLRDDWDTEKNDFGIFPESRREKIQQRWDELLQSFVDLASIVFDKPMNEIAQGNINKLASRARRGVIHGSGDNR